MVGLCQPFQKYIEDESSCSEENDMIRNEIKIIFKRFLAATPCEIRFINNKIGI